MFGRTFYHGTIRKYVIAFGNMFNGIYVQRFDSSNTRIQTLKIPIAYGPKQKFLSRITQDPNLDKDVAISLPRIGFEMVGVNYAPNRKLTSTFKNVKLNSNDLNKFTSQYVPVPYDFIFTMSIFVKNADDGTQILEQILPYFQPEWTNNINLIPELNLVYDVPCVLNDISFEDTYEGDFDTRRSIIWNLNFTMKGYIFGPISNTGIIKRSIVNVFEDNGSDKILQKITVVPGLTANGTPTSTSNNSINYLLIDAEDDYGFITSIEEPQ